MITLNSRGFIFYLSDNRPNHNTEKIGKWMYFFKNKDFVSKICKKAIEENIVDTCKHSDADEGVACFYIEFDNLDENRKYEMAKEKFIKDYVLSKYGTTSPMHTAREDFYSRKLSENDFSFVIVDTILKEYGVDIDPKEVKKLFNERAQQLQKENIKKSRLQQREEELSDLEMERDELLLIEKRDEQQNIGE